MSLRRRIAAAAALAVAAVAVAIGVIGYTSTRSHLVGDLQTQLRQRAAPELQAHPGGARAGGPPRRERGAPDRGPREGGPAAPSPPAFGGAPGYFQVVYPDGTTRALGGGEPQLPVNAKVLEAARRASGSFFMSARVRGTHLEVLTAGDPYDHWAIQVALPLTTVDSVMHGLLLTYGLVIGGGVLLAGLLGAAISRSALAPIRRFLKRTEAVTSELEHPSRIEETGASELRRLAASFNQTLDALELSIEAQRNLVADASHELRTPIAALRSNIQIFLEADRLPAHEREGLRQSILAELDELTQVVADVLELARGSSPSAHREPIELDTVVREAVERARRRAPNARFDLDLERTMIEGTLDRVVRAITNVIDNARKWSPPNGPIEVRLRDGTLWVRDHGPGFDERDLPHVFDRFYRAGNARGHPGSGLGLAIVKQAAQAHGGRAEAANAAGGGAVVKVSFGTPLGTTATDLPQNIGHRPMS
jgi:two-component system sensor histidine kinase MprB